MWKQWISFPSSCLTQKYQNGLVKVFLAQSIGSSVFFEKELDVNINWSKIGLEQPSPDVP